MSVSAEFTDVINVFILNMKTTFPEYESILTKWSGDINKLYGFCSKKYIPCKRFILDKNPVMFEEDSTVDTEFLPHIHFKNIWNCDDISESTKDAIWGYLKLTLLAVDTNEVDLDEAFDSVQELFSKLSVETSDPPVMEVDDLEEEEKEEDTFMDTSVDDDKSGLPESLNGLMSGTLGNIAKDLAEDMLSSPDLNFSESMNIEDAMKSIFSNPAKLSTLVKTVSDKLDTKMKSGEISNTDIMRETTLLMKQMKNIPGMDGLVNMLGKTAGGGGMDSSTTSSSEDRRTNYRNMSSRDKLKERLRQKAAREYITTNK